MFSSTRNIDFTDSGARSKLIENRNSDLSFSYTIGYSKFMIDNDDITSPCLVCSLEQRRFERTMERCTALLNKKESAFVALFE